mmetsp:Transcript_4512/g.10204  ORF Transcript_4512/g.10204 Transcript_4512/m.10204 type:complete len:363 (-) Transcript_4512:4099-5187(-)
MITLKHKDLLHASVHLGHLASKWHPNMAPFIFMERNGTHIIDLHTTLSQLQEAMNTLKALAKAGKKILFVATKKQAKDVVEQEARRLGMPYVTERWLGGTLTNFATIRRLLKKMSSFDKLMRGAAYQNMAKKEQLMIAREKAKLERLLYGIADVTRLPAALCVVDIKKEHIAVKEARKLDIPVFALTDTNTDPNWIDHPIPSNDDASRSIELIIRAIGSAIEDGLAERKKNTETSAMPEQATKVGKGSRTRNVEKITSSEALGQQSTLVENITKTPVTITKAVEDRQHAEAEVTTTFDTKPVEAIEATKQALPSKTKTSTKKEVKKVTPTVGTRSIKAAELTEAPSLMITKAKEIKTAEVPK